MRLRVEMQDAQGAELQPASELTYLHGGYGELLAALESALEGRAPGESVRLQLEPVEATRIPRSALTFSAEGELSVRTVAADGTVASVPVTIVEDGRDEVWVAGPQTGTRVIVQGQDFVKDGQAVEAVAANPAALISRS